MSEPHVTPSRAGGRPSWPEVGSPTARRFLLDYFRGHVIRIDVVHAPLAGEFEPLRRGGALRWGGRELTLRPASAWRERYALADGDREVAVLDGKSWGRRPVKVSVDDLDAIEPGLLLFAAFVVRGLAQDADSSAATGGTVAASSGG